MVYKIKKTLSLLLFLILFISLHGQSNSTSTSENSKIKDKGELVYAKRIGTDFPISNFTTIDGEVLSEAELRGKVVFINFWFRACIPCIAEMKGLHLLFEKYNDNNIVFIMITFDKPEVIREIVKNYDLKYKMISLTQEELATWDLRFGYPSSFILDRDGNIVYAKMGGKFDVESATKEVLEYYGPVIESQLNNKN